MDESTSVMQRIRLAVGRLAVVFRNNVGTGWVGKPVRKPDGSLLLLDPRPLHAGLCEGSSDLIGWQSVTITPEMVGKTVAVFLALEVKTGSGSLSGPQRTFLENVRRAGGIGHVVRSPEQAAAILNTRSLPNITDSL